MTNKSESEFEQKTDGKILVAPFAYPLQHQSGTHAMFANICLTNFACSFQISHT